MVGVLIKGDLFKSAKIRASVLLATLTLAVLLAVAAHAMTITLKTPGNFTFNTTPSRNINFTFEANWSFGGADPFSHENVSNCSLYVSYSPFSNWDTVKNVSTDDSGTDNLLRNASAGLSHLNYTFGQDGNITYGIACLNFTNASSTARLTFSRNHTFVLDTTPPTINTTFNQTNAVIGDGINYTANITDNIGIVSANWTHNFSGNTGAFYTVSGTSSKISNVTSFTRGGVFNFTVFSTDTSGNRNQNSTLIQVTDNLAPTVNATFNISSGSENNHRVINFTANITDETSLASVTITNNMSGTVATSSQTLSGTLAKISNVTSLSAVSGTVINFSMVVSDSSGNTRTNSTLFTIVDTTSSTITLSVPRSSGNHSINPITPTINVSSDAAVCLYEINQSGSNISMSLGSNVCTGTSTYFKNGNHNLTFFVNDTSGNIARSIFHLNMSDRTPPTNPNLTYVDIGNPSSSSVNIDIENINETFNVTLFYDNTFEGMDDSVSESDFSTSHDITISGLSASTTYYVIAKVCDYAGNCATNASRNLNFTTDEVSSGSGGSGGSGGGSGGGGGGGGAAVTTSSNVGTSLSKVWSAVAADTQTVMYINNQDIPLTEISFAPTQALTSAELAVSRLNDKPSSIPILPPGEIFQYVEITPKNFGSSINSATIEFDVLTSWLASNGVDRDTVVLYRYFGGMWNPLATAVSSVKGTEIAYTAITPGFSTFAIGGQTRVESVAVSEPDALAEQTEGQDVPGETLDESLVLPEELTEDPSEKRSYLISIISVIAVLLVIGVIVVMRQRNKEDKDEFSF